MSDVYSLPPDLPVPEDDGAADHIVDARLPELDLPASGDSTWPLSKAASIERLILFAYPRSAGEGEPIPDEWNAIPGARGCTPETLGFRNEYPAFARLGAEVAGLSTQPPAEQAELASRLKLPFQLFSDAGLRLTEALRLPTFEFAGRTLLKRLTLVIRVGVIERVFYPVFPPDEHAAEVRRWLEGRV